jgi:hypothetical protein
MTGWFNCGKFNILPGLNSARIQISECLSTAPGSIVNKLLRTWQRRLVTLLLLSLSLQGFAAAAGPCATMQRPDPVSPSSAQEMDHSMHHGMSRASDNPASGSDCCSGACLCSAVNCLSVLALPASLEFTTTPLPGAPAVVTERAIPMYSPGSLYRPPIPA